MGVGRTVRDRAADSAGNPTDPTAGRDLGESANGASNRETTEADRLSVDRTVALNFQQPTGYRCLNAGSMQRCWFFLAKKTNG